MPSSTILGKLLHQHFKYFMIQAFSTLHPGRCFIDHWHIDVIISSLREMEQGSFTRLVVNIPPRSLKSVIISVAWPAWLLGHNPAYKIIVTSYSQSLSLKHAQDTKAVMESVWYQRLFPKTTIAKGKNTQRKFITTAHGFRLATSVGAATTGEGADIIIVDDPHTPQQAMSLKLRQRVINWYEHTLITRLNDRMHGKIVVVMQRLHREDLSGYLALKGTYQHVILPLYNEQAQTIKIGAAIHQRHAYHLLYQDMDMAALNQLQQELGAYTFAAQYQQNPLLLEHGLIKNHWIQRYTSLLSFENRLIYQSWDCAIKIGENNDYSVCTTWVILNGHYYLLEVLRLRLEYTELKQQVMTCYQQYTPCAVLIEDKASGQQLLQDLHHCSIPAIGIRPSGDKISRLLTVLALFEAGKIWWPQYSPWLAEYEAELFSFPYSAHDDQLDSTTQFLIWSQQQHARLEQTQIRWL